ncbi:hypothetical protein C3V36_05940 [Lachnospiraceae bacterium oral taxon 500]|nr:hypothetical protein C3V36_05940 [Lachnospiraceae bacterium oral taxon 500]
MKRKLTALLLTMCLLLTAFPIPAAAAERITIRIQGDEHVKGFQVGSELKQELVLEADKGKNLEEIINDNPGEPVFNTGYEAENFYTSGGEVIAYERMAAYIPADGETFLVKGKWKEMTNIQMIAAGSSRVYKGGQGLISIAVYDKEDKPNTIPASEYTWSLEGAVQPGTKIEPDGAYGLLTVDSAETAASLTIKAVFRHQAGVEGEYTVSVIDMPTYSGLEIESRIPGDWEPGKVYGLIIKGKKTLTETDNLSPAYFNFALTGNTSPNTKIDPREGYVTVAADELSTSLTVTVAHKTNTALQQSKTFTVTVPDYNLAIKPENPKVKRGESAQFSAYASYTDGSREVEVKAPYLVWRMATSTDSSTITPEGLFTYAQNQEGNQVNVVAEFKGKAAYVTVKEQILESIEITEIHSLSSVTPGGEMQFKAKGKDNFDEDIVFAPGEIKFELVAGGTVAPALEKTSTNTRLDERTGKLIVGRDEFKDKLTVKVSHAATGKSVQMPINVNRGPYTLKLKPQNATVAKGESKQFTAYVVEGSTEVALKPTDLTWKAFVDSAEATQSAITVNGVFTYGAAETATEVAIKATLKYDSTKMANAVVKLGASSNPPLNGYDNGNSSNNGNNNSNNNNNSSNNSSSNTGGPAAPAPQQPKKAEDNKPKPQDKKTDKTNEIIGRFQDIAGHWAQKAIVKAIEKGIFKGVAENSFAPDRQMSRAEFITVLGRMSEQAAVLREIPFSDVNTNAYYAQHVAWGAALGLMKGFEDGTFRPEAKITREQAAVIFANFLKDKKLPESPVTAFGDEENISGWAKEAVKKAAALGLLKGKDGGRFAPKDVLTRAEMAQILDNLSNMLEK